MATRTRRVGMALAMLGLGLTAARAAGDAIPEPALAKITGGITDCEEPATILSSNSCGTCYYTMVYPIKRNCADQVDRLCIHFDSDSCVACEHSITTCPGNYKVYDGDCIAVNEVTQDNPQPCSQTHDTAEAWECQFSTSCRF